MYSVKILEKEKANPNNKHQKDLKKRSYRPNPQQ
jgi:hypothetical protein|tara:strand:- start:1201 stop:1302 length:102 start_codon:yes stop_codon:yes gene_type:complete